MTQTRVSDEELAGLALVGRKADVVELGMEEWSGGFVEWWKTGY